VSPLDTSPAKLQQRMARGTETGTVRGGEEGMSLRCERRKEQTKRGAKGMRQRAEPAHRELSV